VWGRGAHAQFIFGAGGSCWDGSASEVPRVLPCPRPLTGCMHTAACYAAAKSSFAQSCSSLAHPLLPQHDRGSLRVSFSMTAIRGTLIEFSRRGVGIGEAQTRTIHVFVYRYDLHTINRAFPRDPDHQVW